MKVVEIDASACRTVKQFAAELKRAIHAIEAVHGDSVDAFVDSMVFGVMSDLAPPYVVRVTGLKRGSDPERFARTLANAIGQARVERRTRKGEDVEVSLQIVG